MKKDFYLLAIFTACFTLLCLLIAKPFFAENNEEVFSEKNALNNTNLKNIVQNYTIPLLRYNYQNGKCYIYDTKYLTSVSQKGKNDFNLLNLEIHGKLHEQAYGVSGKLIIGYWLEKSVCKINGARNSAFETLLQQEVYVSVEKGKIKHWFFPQEIPERFWSYLQSIILEKQVVLRENKRTWQTIEKYANGKCVVQYKIVNVKNNKADINKIKIKYLDFECKKFLSKAHIRFDYTKGIIKKMSSSENTTVNSMGIISTGNIQFEITYIKTQMRTSIMPNFKNKSLYSQVDQVHFVENTKSSSKKTSKKLNKDGVLTLIKKMQTSTSNNQKLAYNFFRDLVLAMDQHPEQIPIVVNMAIKEKEIHKLAVLLSALRKINNVEGQRGLVKLANVHKSNSKVMEIVIENLGRVAIPEENSAQTIMSIYQKNSEDLQMVTTLSIGNMARNLQNTNPHLSSSFVEALANRFTPQQPQKNTLILESLGNSAHPTAINHIQLYLQDKSEDLRASAVINLRLIKDPSVDRLLHSALLNDSSQKVRINALKAMSYRPLTQEMLDSIIVAINKETIPQLRIKQATLLWYMRMTFPQTKFLVKQIAQQDQSDKVREALRSLMTQ